MYNIIANIIPNVMIQFYIRTAHFDSLIGNFLNYGSLALKIRPFKGDIYSEGPKNIYFYEFINKNY